MPIVVPELAGALAVEMGGQGNSCALFGGGEVRCVGGGAWGVLGNGSEQWQVHYEPVAGLPPAIGLSTGHWHVCVVLADHTVRCWGANMLGQLGNGTTSRMETRPVTVVGLHDVAQVACGGGHTCALLLDGTVQCWGYNVSGQLGDGTTTSRSVPGPVPGLSAVAQIAVGSAHSCALLADGRLLCWGDNHDGELGDGTTIDRHVPTEVVW